ncbi:MAG: hypothetical protein A3B10_02470 [Candidatus Doudnabacteria bacterium RIFCSPLOWO2_01_FULL_44_21]|uniref:Type II secretion system protein GspG C-terminal domain-containing protein n=1 Tax=Candidatus Doudnabacteria bacterium RIFCSPLOWO2_01_FULL_44_21 TaxID=1817841 RepID=A0A1F5PXA4_9BACT|nr:MAG: hypothetical protein A3B95_00980 [Candidatus Doudnabacteria bacterium RIFCSPHIGHO2_02_FULL_43_13b]OGE94494.1 MAG: hypothetical protein A3B10_02470 [Candidatus Doudnabacteria bacterium RIFCSPLOWO2_01_FULL_44_21]
MRIEFWILIVIAVIVVLVTSLAFFSAQTEARDQIKMIDVSRIQKALKIYFDENGFYPYSNNGQPIGINNYLDFWPKPPSADSNCSSTQSDYNYVQKNNGGDFTLTFCLAKARLQIINSQSTQ